ncbi:thioredoxin family protein [Myxococcota bacterium]|jgi:thioredoxin 1|nr:thioredoxin family protein [Myxococcota bacterium]MBU1242809.1 thioredoxin family protein [Myxococcota bacterium]MBU1411920.1 thioredoxin family protein [Myxococcota bacterium]MBU1509608.1 thioredoxin family protein [Myxococcota bacterium]
MLHTKLNHIESTQQYQELLSSGKKIAVVCGRMGPMCIPVYDVMDSLKTKYPDVEFMDMEFDAPVAAETIRRLPETRSFQGLPFTVYFRDGKVAAATSSIQNKQQVKEILDAKLK